MNRTFQPVLGLLRITMTFPTYADDINGNEQKIVSVINNQFEKDGIIYRVKQEYIDSAINYLRQDDADLVPEDVQTVIGEIYANIQIGIESGYLVEVGRMEAGGAAGTPTGETGRQTSGAAETPEGVTRSDGEAEDNEGAGPDAGPENGENPKTSIDETSAAPAESEPEPVAQTISILELMDSIPDQNYDCMTNSTDKPSESLVIPYKTMWYAMLGLVILLTASGLLYLWEKCFAARYHRRLRSTLKQASGAELFYLVLAVETLLGIGVGVFHGSVMLSRLNQTEYYHAIYGGLRRDTRISFALMNIPDKVIGDAITRERMVMAARQQVDSTLHRGSYQANTATLMERLERDIRSYLEDSSIELTDKAETDLNLLMKRLDERYTQLLKWPFAPWWVQLADRFVPSMKKARASLSIMTVTAHLPLLWIYHYVHRAIRTYDRRVLAASMAALLLGAIPYMGNLVVRYEITPEYMSQFFYGHERGILLAMMTIGAAGILVGIGYLLMTRSWKEGKQQQ